MYGIYANIYHQYTPFMLPYIPYMDPMGNCPKVANGLENFQKSHLARPLVAPCITGTDCFMRYGTPPFIWRDRLLKSGVRGLIIVIYADSSHREARSVPQLYVAKRNPINYEP